MSFLTKAPITAEQRLQLLNDARDVKGTTLRKGFYVDPWYIEDEERFAKKYFELGCWLFYYDENLIPGRKDYLQMRVDCLLKIYLSGIVDLTCGFQTVFNFGERRYDDIFESGDADAVRNRLREYLPSDKTGLLAKAFDYNGWSLTDNSRWSLTDDSIKQSLI